MSQDRTDMDAAISRAGPADLDALALLFDA